MDKLKTNTSSIWSNKQLRSKIIGYVNPDYPTQAVLNRELGGLSFWALTICSTLAWLGGIIGIVVTIRNYRRKQALAGNYDYALVEEHFKSSESMPLKVKRGPIQQFIIITFVAIFFNGMIAIFIIQGIDNLSNDLFGWLTIAFTILFSFVGLFFIMMACYMFIGLFVPTPEVRIDKNIVTPGETFLINWRFVNACNNLKNLDIELVCVKSVIKTKSSKGSPVAQSNFTTIRVEQLTDKSAMQTGEVTVKFPADMQVSVLDDYPRYNWYIRFAGKIARRPEFTFDYEFAIVPKK